MFSPTRAHSANSTARASRGDGSLPTPGHYDLFSSLPSASAGKKYHEVRVWSNQLCVTVWKVKTLGLWPRPKQLSKEFHGMQRELQTAVATVITVHAIHALHDMKRSSDVSNAVFPARALVLQIADVTLHYTLLLAHAAARKYGCVS